MAQRIVVLDGFTLTPNEPRAQADAAEPVWDAVAALGELEVHARTPAEQVVERVGDAPVALTNKAPLDAAAIRNLTDLKYIGVLATGTNVVDLEAAKAAGVTVTNVPAYSTDSVAQHVFAMLLELVSHVAAHDRAVHADKWVRSDDFSFRVAPITELAGKKLGVVGVGDIGRSVGRIGHALGMEVLAYSRTRKDLPYPCRWMELNELFAEADVVTLHCPLTDETQHLVNAGRLAKMKPTTYLINTGRGPLVNEAALADVLNAGRLAGAGLDVLSSEPPAEDNPLLKAKRCIITPHVAWASREARMRLMEIAAGNLKAFLDGSPRNVVNP